MAETSQKRREMDRRRGEILREALRLFLHEGFEGTSLREIADAVGTSKANVYYHFRSKESILVALFGPSFDSVEKLLDEKPDEPTLLRGYLEIMLSNRELARFLATDLSVMAQPEIGDRARKLLLGLRGQLAGEGYDLEGWIAAECALGVLRSAAISFPEADDATLTRIAMDKAQRVLASD